jgi:ABC-type multidrug transport system fused ATPase/permease subunit
VVAHRLSTIEHADRILVMHGGEIRESGTHAALLQQRGLYYRLYQLQYARVAAAPDLQPAAAS